jgi:hypothetical protein
MARSNHNGAAMSQLTLASVTPALDTMPARQWAHDIRNALAVTGLHLETLERLSGSAGRKAASAAQAVMKRASDLCNASLAQTGRSGQGSRRRGFDLMLTIKEFRGDSKSASRRKRCVWFWAIPPTSTGSCSISFRTRSRLPATVHG